MGVWTSPTVWVGLIVVTTTAAIALAAGGAFERRAAPWVWVGWAMTPLLQGLMAEYAPALLFTLIDGALLLVLGALAWGGGRFWPIAVVAAQSAVLVVDLLRLATPMGTWVYLTALAAASYVLILTLLAGTWSSWRERRAWPRTT